jgi:peptide/nickel transport system permease protein
MLVRTIWLGAQVLSIMLVGALATAALVHFSPGNAIDAREFDSRLSEASVQALRDKRAHTSLWQVWVHHIQLLIEGNLGESATTGRPVIELIGERIEPTAALIAGGAIVGLTAALVLAVLSICGANTASIITAAASTTFICIPAGVFAIAIVVWGANPVWAIAIVVFSRTHLHFFTAISRSIRSDWALSARASGQGQLYIATMQVGPATAPQLWSIAGIGALTAINTALPVEVICGLPGIGQLAWQAAMQRDLPVVLGVTMLILTACCTLSALVTSSSDRQNV